jgi:hypothetical protein
MPSHNPYAPYEDPYRSTAPPYGGPMPGQTYSTEMIGNAAYNPYAPYEDPYRSTAPPYGGPMPGQTYSTEMIGNAAYNPYAPYEDPYRSTAPQYSDPGFGMQPAQQQPSSYPAQQPPPPAMYNPTNPTGAPLPTKTTLDNRIQYQGGGQEGAGTGATWNQSASGTNTGSLSDAMPGYATSGALRGNPPPPPGGWPEATNRTTRDFSTINPGGDDTVDPIALTGAKVLGPIGSESSLSDAMPGYATSGALRGGAGGAGGSADPLPPVTGDQYTYGGTTPQDLNIQNFQGGGAMIPPYLRGMQFAGMPWSASMPSAPSSMATSARPGLQGGNYSTPSSLQQLQGVSDPVLGGNVSDESVYRSTAPQYGGPFGSGSDDYQPAPATGESFKDDTDPYAVESYTANQFTPHKKPGPQPSLAYQRGGQQGLPPVPAGGPIQSYNNPIGRTIQNFNSPAGGSIESYTANQGYLPPGLAKMMSGPIAGQRDTSQIEQQLLDAISGRSNFSDATPGGAISGGMPALEPLFANMRQEQARERDNLMQSLITRGVGNSTIADQALTQQGVTQKANMADLATRTMSQIMPMQISALMNLQSNQRAQRAQESGELLAAIGAGEQIRQGATSRDLAQRGQGQSEQGQLFGQGLAGRQQGQSEQGQLFGQGLAGRQQGQSEQGQLFGQGMQGRQQGVNEILQSLGLGEQLQQGAFGRQATARGIAEQEQQGRFGRELQGRQQGINEFLNAIGQSEALRQGQFGRDLAGRQQGAVEAGQGFGQNMQREQQDMSNYFQFFNAQQQMDQVQRAQQNQALALMLNALGQNAINPQMPSGSIPPPPPGIGSAVGGILGNVGTAFAGSEKGSALIDDALRKIF